MSHVVKDIGWGVIDIIRHEHRIFFQQRWLYDWQVAAGLSRWTTLEKRQLHAQVDRLIWRTWSNRVKLASVGKREYEIGGTWPINLDVRWVTKRPHWTVTITKVAAGTAGVGEVFWDARRISLNTGDMVRSTVCTDAPAPAQVCRANFETVPHEFGHAFGNTAVLSRGDEYRTTSPHLADTSSILNIGNQLRTRHFRTLLEGMNTMVPGVVWSVSSIRN